jgi:hypothetical protein
MSSRFCLNCGLPVSTLDSMMGMWAHLWLAGFVGAA